MRLKHTLIAACLITTGGLATACGGNDDSTSAPSDTSSSASADATAAGDPSSAPSDTSAADFCKGLTSTAQISDGKDVAAFASTLASNGTPADIPDAARTGFEVYVGALESVDATASADDLKKMGDLGLSKADQRKVQTFVTYAGTVCAPTGTPTNEQ
jgi:hypothetical protein